jgi:hypothetical protein
MYWGLNFRFGKKPVTNGTKLGDMMAQDMSIATKYGEYFTNPKQGKFARANSNTMLLADALAIVSI